MLLSLDMMIQSLIEMLCRRIQRTVGISNFFFARVFLVLSAALFLPLAHWAAIEPRFSYPFKLSISLAIAVIVIRVAPWRLFDIMRVEKEAVSLAMRGLKRDVSLPERYMRILLVALSTSLLFSGTFISDILTRLAAHSAGFSFLSFSLYAYCVRCTPLPPAPSRLRQLTDRCKSLIVAPAPISEGRGT